MKRLHHLQHLNMFTGHKPDDDDDGGGDGGQIGRHKTATSQQREHEHVFYLHRCSGVSVMKMKMMKIKLL